MGGREGGREGGGGNSGETLLEFHLGMQGGEEARCISTRTGADGRRFIGGVAGATLVAGDFPFSHGQFMVIRRLQ
jgi:hypothetical protein